MLPHLASRIFGTPLLVHRAKLDVILSALGPRLGIDSPILADAKELLAAVPATRPNMQGAVGIAVIPIHGTLVKRTLGLEAASGLTSYQDIGVMLDAALAGLEPGTLQILEPGEDIKFSAPAVVGSSYAEFMRQQFRAVAAAMGITYEMLTGDLTQVNYSSIRAGLLEFRRRCEVIQHGVIVHQLCRPIWRAWMDQAVLEGALMLPGYSRRQREYQVAKWIPQGWQWVDPQKEFNAMKLAIRAGLTSRSEAISAYGYDAEDVDREIAADNARADALGLVFDSDPRHDQAPAVAPPPPTEQPTE